MVSRAGSGTSASERSRFVRVRAVRVEGRVFISKEDLAAWLVDETDAATDKRTADVLAAIVGELQKVTA